MILPFRPPRAPAALAATAPGRIKCSTPECNRLTSLGECPDCQRKEYARLRATGQLAPIDIRTRQEQKRRQTP